MILQKKISITFLSLFLAFHGFGQNLIANHDFEFGPDSSSVAWAYFVDPFCSNSEPVSGPDFWVNPNSGSPDRMVEGTVFTCNWDLDTAQSGTSWVDFGYDNEAGKSSLISGIIKDSTYRLRAYLKLETFQGTQLQPHRIAFVFTDSDSIAAPYTTISSSWVLLDTIFVASENSNEITIRGIEPVGSATKVDNISLEKISTNDLSHILMPNNKIFLYPNPACEIINIETDSEIENSKIYDQYGNCVLISNSSQINIVSLDSGVYYIEITVNGNKYLTKIIKTDKL